MWKPTLSVAYHVRGVCMPPKGRVETLPSALRAKLPPRRPITPEEVERLPAFRSREQRRREAEADGEAAGDRRDAERVRSGRRHPGAAEDVAGRGADPAIDDRGQPTIAIAGGAARAKRNCGRVMSSLSG